MTEGARELPHAVVDPARIPVERYFDEAFFRLECERLWPRVWQMACRLEQIPEVGDWVEYHNLGRSVIVVRTQAGVRAYHNACRHRGVPLVPEGSHGNARGQGFICPFHGWRWNLEGENTFVYGRHLFSQRQLDPADIALPACRVEEALGCAFINFDDQAPSLRECLGEVVDRLEAHGAANMRAEWWYATELPANWKIAMEAFMEGYHVMRTHPQLQRALPALYNQRYGHDTGGIGLPVNPNQTVRQNIAAQVRHFELLSEGMAGMVHAKEVEIIRQLADVPLPDDPETAIPQWFGIVQAEITRRLRERGEPVPDLNEVAVSHPVNAVEFLFPHYFLLPTFTSMSAYRIRPLAPERCLFEIWSLTHFPPGQEPPPVMAPRVLPHDSEAFPPIPRQDYSNIPAQQRGCHAGGFRFMRLAEQVEGLISNYQRIIDGYLRGVEPARLAAATRKLGGNFDGPILELGL